MADLLRAARDVADIVEAHADRAERDRRLPMTVVDALRDADLLRMCVPRAYGGPEADPVTMAKAIEAVSTADGAAGWCTMIASTTSSLSAFLPAEAACEMFAHRQHISGGVFAPNGTARVVDGGWNVSGVWSWGSGTQHCRYILGGARIGAGESARDGDEFRLMFFNAADVRIHDTWHTSGLRGTGSNDFSVTDVFVPRERSIVARGSRPIIETPLAMFPNFTLLAIGVASVALGLARRAIDEFVDVAVHKRPQFSQRTIAQSGTSQTDLARAEAHLRSARAFLFGEVADAWDIALNGGKVDLDARVRIRLAGANAVDAATRAIDSVYTMAGGMAVFETSQLQRCLRDVHVVSQHIMVAPRLFETLGKHLFGAEIDSSSI
jgi:indole-3-acetate monooxygenase